MRCLAKTSRFSWIKTWLKLIKYNRRCWLIEDRCEMWNERFWSPDDSPTFHQMLIWKISQRNLNSAETTVLWKALWRIRKPRNDLKDFVENLLGRWESFSFCWDLRNFSRKPFSAGAMLLGLLFIRLFDDICGVKKNQTKGVERGSSQEKSQLQAMWKRKNSLLQIETQNNRTKKLLWLISWTSPGDRWAFDTTEQKIN